MNREKLHKDKQTFKVKSIPEKDFKEKMQEGVEPLINQIRKQGYFARTGDKNIQVILIVQYFLLLCSKLIQERYRLGWGVLWQILRY